MKTSLRVACPLVFLLWASSSVLGADGLCVPIEPPPSAETLVPTGPDQPAPVVTVKVEAPACAQPGKNLEYRITVKNLSPAAAYNVVIHNAISAHARFVQASPRPHKTVPELQWNLGTMAGYGCQEITLILAPTDAEDITNCTRASYEHGVCVTTRSAGSAPAPTPAKPTTKEPPRSNKAKLKVRVTGPREQKVDVPAHYKLTVTNVGTDPAKNVVAYVSLDEKLAFVSAKNDGHFAGHEIVWDTSDLKVNASWTVEFTVRAKETGKICFKSRAIADGGVETIDNATCTTFGAAALQLQLFDRPDPVPVGATATYLIFVQNTGQLTVTNVRLQATLPSGMELLRAEGRTEYRTEGKTISFEPVDTLIPGARVEFEVQTKARTPGDQRFKLQMTADQIREGGPVLAEESTTVYADTATR